MEWIETTGRTVEEAKEAALDELGVDEQDAEFEILAEPKTGLFGRMRVEARVRARVEPTAPRPKEDRRDRRRKRAPENGSSTEQGGRSPSVVAEDAPISTPALPSDPGQGGTAQGSAPDRTPRASSPKGPRGADAANEERNGRVSHIDIPLEEQGRVGQEFLAGLLKEFGLTAEVASTVGEEDSVELEVTGDNLGLLIGPKGTTLLALQDLTRSAVQQKTNAGNGRIHVDVAGYRQKRSEALARFALEVAETVKSSGTRQVLEPMSAMDRKVIHDALSDVGGISTASEGEDAQRRVVVMPTSA